MASGLIQVAGGFSQSIRAGSTKDATGTRKGRQFRLKICIEESLGPVQVRKATALARLVDIVAMRDALVAVGRGAQAEYLMRKAGAVASDPEMFAFAIAAANVVMTRPGERQSEARAKFSTWGELARAWCTQELAQLYPNAGYDKKTAEDTDQPRVEFLAQFIGNVPLVSFNDDDYWRAMRPARARCKTDSTFKQYAQVARRVLKIGVELKLIPAWPLSAVCKLPKIAKGSGPEFPFLYPDEYVRLMRCVTIRFEYRVLWGFILREGLRIAEAFRIQWEHLEQLPNGRWLLAVPETKTGRALSFVLNPGSGEVLQALRLLMPDQPGPFAWLKATNIKKAAAQLRKHIEESGTTRERLLYTSGRLRRLREHDLRSTFVTWCKLAGVDNETISQHTGHESSQMIARYNRSKATIEHLGLPPYLPLDEALPVPAPAGEDLNTWNGCDKGCDAAGAGDGQPAPADEESGMNGALVRETGVEPARLAALEPKSEPRRPEGAKREETGGGPAPEGAGSDPASHLGVTLLEAAPGGGPRQAETYGFGGRVSPRNSSEAVEIDHAENGGSGSSQPGLARDAGYCPATPAPSPVDAGDHPTERTNPDNAAAAAFLTTAAKLVEATADSPVITSAPTQLELLRATARAALEASNWALLDSLRPLIEAEERRPPPAPAPAPISLDAFRAKRESGK